MDESKSTSYSANFVYKQTLGSEVKTIFGGEQNSDFRNRFQKYEAQEVVNMRCASKNKETAAISTSLFRLRIAAYLIATAF